MKSSRTTVFSILLVAFLFSLGASAAMTLTCANQSGAVGTTKTMTVNLVYDGSRTLIGGDLILTYDPTVFTTVGNFALGAAATSKLQFAQAPFADAANSEIVINLDDNFGQLPGIMSANGVLVTFDVTVAAGAPSGVKNFAWRNALGPNGYKTNFQADTEVAITTLTGSQFTVLRYFNAIADVAACSEDAVNTQIDVTANDVTETGEHPTSGITLNSVTQPAHGTVAVQNGKVVYTPAANYFGTDSFTYTATHARTAAPAGSYQSTGTVTVTVTAVNDTPSFTKGANQTVNEDAGPQTVAGWDTNISAGPANEAAQAVDFIVSNTNNALFSAQPAIAANGTLTYTPAANANGTATVTVQIHDNGGDGALATSAAQTFTIAVNPVNDAPSFTKGGDQMVNEDVGPRTVANWATGFSVGPANESTQSPAFVITGNTNPGIFSVAPAISAAGTLTYTPCTTSAACGTSTISVKVTDNGGTDLGGVNESAVQTFTVTVNPVNDLPTASLAITDAGLLVDGGTITASVTASDEETATSSLTYAYVWKKNGTTVKTVPATAAAATSTLTNTDHVYSNGQNYSITCEVTVADANGGSITRSAQTFVGNQPPSITASTATPTNPTGTAVSDTEATTSLTINEGQGVSFSVTFSDAGHSPADDGIVAIAWEYKVNDGAFAPLGTGTIFTQPYSSPKTSTNSITTDYFTSNLSRNTVIVVTATATDGQELPKAKSWTVTVTDVNQTPAFTPGGAVTVNEDSGAYSQAWATSITAGLAEDVTGQTVAFTTARVSGASDLFSTAPAISPSGILTFTPAPDKNGSATYNVVARDNAPANFQSASRQFTIIVQAVNDPPSFAGGGHVTLYEDGDTGAATQLQSLSHSGYQVAGWATDISAGPANEGAQSVHFEVSNTSPDLFTVQPALDPATGNLTFTLAHHKYGTASVMAILKDDGGTANYGSDTSALAQFTITVNPVNDIPTVPAGLNGFVLAQQQTVTPLTIVAGDPEIGDPVAMGTVVFQFALPPNDGQEPLWQTLSAGATQLEWISEVAGTAAYRRRLSYVSHSDGSLAFHYAALSDFRGTDIILFRGMDSGGVVSATGTLSVGVGGWTLEITASGATSPLRLGCVPGGADTFDPWDQDLPFAPPGSFGTAAIAFFPSDEAGHTQLARDYRPLDSDDAVWLLSVTATPTADVHLQWDPLELADLASEGKTIAMYELLEAQRDSLILMDRSAPSDFPTVPRGETHVFVIRYTTLPVLLLGPGSNLISLPVNPTVTAAVNLLVDESGSAVYDGSVWKHNGTAYVAAQTLEALTGYWVYARTWSIVPLRGTPAPSELRTLSRGWNLIGVAAPLFLPLADWRFPVSGQASSWNNQRQEYEYTRWLQPCLAYWIKLDGNDLRP